jgi:hypothetical protein
VDEVQRIIFETQNQDKLRAATHDLELEKDALLKLSTELRNGTINQAQFDAGAARMASRVRDLTKDVAELTKQTRQFSSGSLLQLQYVMDDLVNTSGNWERHLASISNNIPGLISSLGMGAGVAGAVGMVSTALIALAPVAKAAWQEMTGEGPGLAKEALKEIEDHIKKVREEFEKLKNAPTTGESASAAGVKEYLGQRPVAERAAAGAAESFTGAEVEGGMNDQEKEELFGTHAADMSDEEIDRLVSRVYPFRQPAVRKQLEDARLAAQLKRPDIFGGARKRMGMELVTTAPKAGPAGNAATARLQRMAEARPELFPHGFGGEMASLRPEQLERDAAESDEAAAEFDQSTERWRAHKKALAARRRNAAALTRQGQENEEHMRREQERQQLQDERDAKREIEQMLRSEKNRPLEQAQAGLINMAQREGQPLSDAQIISGARQILSQMQQQIDQKTATIATLRGIQTEMMRAQANAQRLGMPTDQSGNFSPMSPFTPGSG